MNNTLRSELQQKFADKIIVNNKNGLLNASIRLGKTRIALLTVKVDEVPLIVYTNRKIKERWIEDNIKFNFNRKLEFCTTASLKKLVGKGLKYDYIIADEIHKYSPAQLDNLEKLQNKSILGISGSLKMNSLIKLQQKLNLRILVKYTLEDAIKDKLVKDYELNIHVIPMDNKQSIYKSLVNYGKSIRTEQEHYNYLTETMNWCEVKKLSSFDTVEFNKYNMLFKKYMGLRTNFIYNSSTLLNYSKKIVEQLKDQKVLIFTLRTEIADELSNTSYHNNNVDDLGLDEFLLSIDGHLSTVNMIAEGVTINNLDNIVCHTVDSNAETFIQKIGRGLQLGDMNNNICKIHVIVLKNTVQETWLEKACETLNQSKIFYVQNGKTISKLDKLKLDYPNEEIYLYTKTNTYVYKCGEMLNFIDELVTAYKFFTSDKLYPLKINQLIKC